MGYNKNTVEMIAKDVLNRSNMQDIPADPLAIANSKHIKVYAIDFNIYDGDRVSGAISKNEDGEVVIYVNENDTYERQRFTIAHELGHFFLHIEDKPYEKIDMYRAMNYLTNDEQEIEANNFAAALLMDKEKVSKKYVIAKQFGMSDRECISYLANLFEVSKQAMEYRMKNIGLL